MKVEELKKELEKVYERLAQNRYGRPYKNLNNTQKFVLEMDFDRAV